ncbi:flagellar basal body-associated FliL family protein [Palleronia sp. LCG004]|uniref:flagellar basal body-associated FliL family protein n=1 Tax=Palleronia sp. LCG004 TaxID=3079304 RepID=UPI002941D8CA|nr:flagellar basal body-associated FliL family protein [Palleronia sp. LCG004]WOI56178.1 flagellar basal body-associated FliL family protein [Palleronia sp. LCG004]
MADEEKSQGAEAPKKSGKKGLVIGLALAAIAGGGGFYAVQSGMILGHGDSHGEEHAESESTFEPLPQVAFLPLDPMTVSLPPGAGSKHLRFRGELEVADGEQAAVEAMKPRVVDVMNSYLRAVEPSELRQPEALLHLRAQLLRRIQLVVGDGRVRDLLVMEFVLS